MVHEEGGQAVWDELYVQLIHHVMDPRDSEKFNRVAQRIVTYGDKTSVRFYRRYGFSRARRRPSVSWRSDQSELIPPKWMDGTQWVVLEISPEYLERIVDRMEAAGRAEEANLIRRLISWLRDRETAQSRFDSRQSH